nr:TPA_exp: holocytochrome c synthase [Selaginella uncinata]
MEKKSIPERIHDFYYKVFPSADCPVTGSKHSAPCSSDSPSQSSCPVSDDSRSQSSCPVSEEARSRYKHPHVYDVYSRRIDEQAKAEEEAWKVPRFLYSSSILGMSPASMGINPANRMPKVANQQPAPGQKEPLATSRQVSTIPKAGTEGTWLYPSQQMFFNSLVRKNKADDVTEKDMEAVVATHNFVNETTWARLLQWEKMYTSLFPASTGEEPRLLRFQGRPHELSPKARVKKLLGRGEPFDRHDWIVDRGGREMRYVIDFYYDEAASEQNRWPFYIDVRPALDSPAAVLLRARMLLHEAVSSHSNESQQSVS